MIFLQFILQEIILCKESAEYSFIFFVNSELL